MISPNNYPGGIWACDFEFRPENGVEGNCPQPVCMVAKNLNNGEIIRLWQDEMARMSSAPFATDTTSLFIAYYASAEISCFIALNWPLPENILDLFIVFRSHTNGRDKIGGNGLLGALAFFALPAITTENKDNFRSLILNGGPWDEHQKNLILNYCESDVEALALLLPYLEPHIDWPRMLLQGQYTKAAARIENNGVPLDVATLNHVKEHWGRIQENLISEVNANFNVYDGMSFRVHLFEEYLIRNKIEWPTLPSGALDLNDETFKEMARIHPKIISLCELRSTLARMRLFELPIGTDGRNRCILSMYQSVTGRNQPSSSRFIFGPSTWLRGFIKPAEGYGLAYIDWSQQEFGIAAALSGDPRMCDAYLTGDPYLAFAKQAGAVPEGATKKTHNLEREQFKQCVLAVQYGMGAESLALRINQPVARAKQLLNLHRRTYPIFWAWSDRVVNHGLLGGQLWTTFGWRRHVGSGTNVRSLQNFPMQANGAEMLRLACVRLTEQNIRICAPVHDALLVEVPLDHLDTTVAHVQDAMRWASAVVLQGFELNSDVKIVRYPERYMDPRGTIMWNTVMKLLAMDDRLVPDS